LATPKTGLNKFGDLKRRLLFLLGALVVYRIGTFIPVPGIDPLVLDQLFKSQTGASWECSTCSPVARCLASSVFCIGNHAVHFGFDYRATHDDRVASA